MNGKWTGRIAAVAGLAFGILLFLSVTEAEPLKHATDAATTEWWSDSSNRQTLFISMYFRLAAVPFFLGFLTILRSRLRAAEGPDGWSDLVYSFGMVAAVGMAISSVGRGALAASINFGDDPVPGVDMLRYVVTDSIGIYGLIAMPAASLMAGLASVISLRTKAFPMWLGVLGLVVLALDVLLVAMSIGSFITPLISIWALGAGICIARGKTEAVMDGAPTRPAVQMT